MGNSKNILITGASGLIGTRLTELLLQRGDAVSHLGRARNKSTIPGFTWDINRQVVDVEAFSNVNSIVHLAGAGVADERWTHSRKREILESRIKSTRLLFETLKKQKHFVRSFVSASAIGYYGFDSDEVLTEANPPGKDFLADVTRQWEQEVDRLSELGIRVVKLRIGIVLSEKGGALKKMATPVKFFVGAPLGTGDQYMSWIHIDDLCGIFIKAIDDETMQGAYNATSLTPVTNREMTKAIGKAVGRPVFFPAVPRFALKLFLGEMADIVLRGSKVSSEKIQKAGYSFQFTTIESALKNLLS